MPVEIVPWSLCTLRGLRFHCQKLLQPGLTNLVAGATVWGEQQTGNLDCIAWGRPFNLAKVGRKTKAWSICVRTKPNDHLAKLIVVKDILGCGVFPIGSVVQPRSTIDLPRPVDSHGTPSVKIGSVICIRDCVSSCSNNSPALLRLSSSISSLV